MDVYRQLFARVDEAQEQDNLVLESKKPSLVSDDFIKEAATLYVNEGITPGLVISEMDLGDEMEPSDIDSIFESFDSDSSVRGKVVAVIEKAMDNFVSFYYEGMKKVGSPVSGLLGYREWQDIKRIWREARNLSESWSAYEGFDSLEESLGEDAHKVMSNLFERALNWYQKAFKQFLDLKKVKSPKQLGKEGWAEWKTTIPRLVKGAATQAVEPEEEFASSADIPARGVVIKPEPDSEEKATNAIAGATSTSKPSEEEPEVKGIVIEPEKDRPRHNPAFTRQLEPATKASKELGKKKFSRYDTLKANAGKKVAVTNATSGGGSNGEGEWEEILSQTKVTTKSGQTRKQNIVTMKSLRAKLTPDQKKELKKYNKDKERFRKGKLKSAPVKPSFIEAFEDALLATKSLYEGDMDTIIPVVASVIEEALMDFTNLVKVYSRKVGRDSEVSYSPTNVKREWMSLGASKYNSPEFDSLAERFGEEFLVGHLDAIMEKKLGWLQIAFQNYMKEWGIKSPKELDKEKRREFFSKWKSMDKSKFKPRKESSDDINDIFGDCINEEENISEASALVRRLVRMPGVLHSITGDIPKRKRFGQVMQAVSKYKNAIGVKNPWRMAKLAWSVVKGAAKKGWNIASRPTKSFGRDIMRGVKMVPQNSSVEEGSINALLEGFSKL